MKEQRKKTRPPTRYEWKKFQVKPITKEMKEQRKKTRPPTRYEWKKFQVKSITPGT